MDIHLSKQEFAQICKEHGFSRHGNVFSRCIGDAIFQNISLASSDYMNPSSPEYTTTRRKSPYIKIGCWSLYSNLQAFYFEDRKYIGTFFPENFRGLKFCRDTFMGLQNQYQIMITDVFRDLDAMTTQRQLINMSYALQKAQYSFTKPHQIDLCIPHIICGEYEGALKHLYSLYAVNWLGFHMEHDHLKENGQLQEYIKQETLFDDKQAYITMLLKLVLGKKQAELKKLANVHLMRNIELARKNKIAFSENFFPLLGE